MQNSLSHYTLLVRRWAWLVILGVTLCGGTTFLISKLISPVYQSSVTIIINMTSSTSSYDNVSASELIAPTYAQLLTSRQVLQPVLARHPGLTFNQLSSMVTAKPQSNTTLIELDVENSNPNMAMQLANEISQSFAFYANAQLLGSVQVSPTVRPDRPIRPQSLLYTEIGALVGLGLALALVVLFEWIDDHLGRPEEVGELLDLETLATLPLLSSKHLCKRVEEVPALVKACRMLYASLKSAQASQPFKLIMITSAQPGEGKSTIAANLASFLASVGNRVLLVDANLHHPVLDQRFRIKNSLGFLQALQESWAQAQIEAGGQEVNIPNLLVLTTGVSTLNSTELLQSPQAQQFFDCLAKAPFDYILLDSPSLLPVINAQILASYAQTILLVVDASKTSRGALREAQYMLSRIHAHTIGVVINKSPWPHFSESNCRSSRRPPETMATVPLPLDGWVDPRITASPQQGGSEKS